MRLTTTLNRIQQWIPCDPGWKKLTKYLVSKGWDLKKNKHRSLNMLTILESNGMDDMFWAFRCTIQDSKKASVSIAIEFSKSVLPIFEKEFPDDSRSRKAIGAAENYLKNPTDDGAAYAARAAARDGDGAAARAATRAAYAAARDGDAAAYAAARAAARAAAYAARAAARAAYAAGDGAAAYAGAARDGDAAAYAGAAGAAARDGDAGAYAGAAGAAARAAYAGAYAGAAGAAARAAYAGEKQIQIEIIKNILKDE